MSSGANNPLQASKLALLQRAATFVECHALNKPMFEKVMGTGKQRVLVRLFWPLKLSVHDYASGELLVESEEGAIDRISLEFMRAVLKHTQWQGRS